jgi:hypothetical protein
MSDLQCPATFLVLGPAGTEAVGRLAGTRLAAVYAVPEGREVATAVAGISDLPVSALEPDGSSYAAARDGLADLHRGETVLVVLPEAVASTLAGGGEDRETAGAEVLEVAVDSDGWSVRIWTSAPAEP